MVAEGCLLLWYALMALLVAARGTVLVWRALRGGEYGALLWGVPLTAIMLAASAVLAARGEPLLFD